MDTSMTSRKILGGKRVAFAQQGSQKKGR